ncbi:D-tyrosyl-tRNA(Tyr) deacylase, partial [Candidatus Bathyarchaeota archaeon]
LLDEELVRQMVERTLDGVEVAILDHKGMKGRQRRRVEELLEKLGVEYERR